jgi:hypothetical protein
MHLHLSFVFAHILCMCEFLTHVHISYMHVFTLYLQGSKPVSTGNKVTFSGLEPSEPYTCTACFASDQTKCSSTVWTCTTLAKVRLLLSPFCLYF